MENTPRRSRARMLYLPVLAVAVALVAAVSSWATNPIGSAAPAQQGAAPATQQIQDTETTTPRHRAIRPSEQPPQAHCAPMARPRRRRTRRRRRGRGPVRRTGHRDRRRAPVLPAGEPHPAGGPDAARAADARAGRPDRRARGRARRRGPGAAARRAARLAARFAAFDAFLLRRLLDAVAPRPDVARLGAARAPARRRRDRGAVPRARLQRTASVGPLRRGGGDGAQGVLARAALRARGGAADRGRRSGAGQRTCGSPTSRCSTASSVRSPVGHRWRWPRRSQTSKTGWASPRSVRGMSTISPIIPYRDVRAAVDFLCEAFGFERHELHEGRRRRARPRRAALRRRRDHADLRALGAAGHAHTYVVVADADAHHDHAKASGAKITSELKDTDYGSRDYSAEDLDANAWHFGTYRPLA